MRVPKNYVSPEKGPGTVTLRSKDVRKIAVLGATFPVSVGSRGYKGRHLEITLAPRKGQKGLIAITLDASGHQSIEMIFEVDYTGNEPHVNLDTTWSPSAYRLGQIDGDDIKVLINGEWHRTDYHNNSEDNAVIVPDGNILLQYLYGDIARTKVEEAATMMTGNKARERVARLEKDLEDWKRLYQDAIGMSYTNLKKTEDLAKKLEDEQKAHEETDKKRARLSILSNSLNYYLSGASSALSEGGWKLKRTRIKNALRYITGGIERYSKG